MLSAQLPSMAAMPETRRPQKVLEKRFNRDPQLFDHVTACEDTLWVFLFRVSFLTLFFFDIVLLFRRLYDLGSHHNLSSQNIWIVVGW